MKGSQNKRRYGWYQLTACALLLLGFMVACSALLDHNAQQCVTDDDCAHFGGHPYCTSGVCTASGLGPANCFLGMPMQPDDFANQCSTATCGSFDDCARLGICGDAGVPATVAPPVIDASSAPPVDAPPPAMTPCVDPANRNTIVISGSTAVQPFMSVVAPLLAAQSPAYQIAYQPAGSCTGVDDMFNPDTSKRTIHDIVGKQALLFNTDGTSVPCSFGTGALIDVAVSDVYSTSCNTAYVPTSAVADYHGPIQPMVFVVPSASGETTISSDMGHQVFGRGTTDPASAPYTDPKLYFVRNSGSGTQQMISRAISVDPTKWWGIDRGGSPAVASDLEQVNPDDAGKAIGILSTDFADAQRSRLRILAYRANDQTCAYYPDSSQFTQDKANVRDGHYSIWGPIHFYAEVSNGLPSAAAGALVTRFTLSRLDQPMLTAITGIGFVPDCAMNVSRSAEMGPLSTYSPQFHCGCYFDSNVPGGTTPASCTACSGPSDCPTTSPACNNGYCEVR